MFEVNRLCRTCLTTDKELLSVFALIEEDSNSRIIDYFNECLNYKIIEGDNLPQMICLSCLDNILEVRKFYVQCVDAEHYLKEQMSETDQIKNEEFITIVRKASPTAIKEEYSEIEALNDDDIDNDEIAVNDVIEFEMLDATTSTNVGIVATPTATTSAVATTEIYEENLYECSKCTEGFKYEKNYKLHMKMEHGFSRDEIEVTLQNLNSTLESQENENDGEDAGEDEEQHKDISKKSSKKFQCQLCDYSFSFKRNYDTHMRRHSAENKSDGEGKSSEKIRIKCTECDRKFCSKNAVQRHFAAFHLQDNEIDLICPCCHVELASKKDLEIHLSQQHRIEQTKDNGNGSGSVRKKYSCRFCGKEFISKDNYLSHERTHTGERPFKCQYCEKSFIQRSTLATHVSLHTGKRISCPLCDKKFCRQGFLKIHMRSHTDERPYACDLCPQRYTQKSHLHSHVQSVHSHERPFKCDFCEMKFNRKGILQHHLFTHIGKPFKCPACPVECSLLHRFRKHLINSHNIHEDPRNFKRDLIYDPNTMQEINDIINEENIEILEGDGHIDDIIIVNFD